MTDVEQIDVLLVEDDMDDAQYVKRLLGEFGSVSDRLLEVTSVEHVDRLAAAMDAIESEPDVVLLDLNLSDSAGIETVERMIELAPHLPVVVITGQQETGLGPEAIRQGAQDYLQKGRITDEVLHRTLRYAIDRHEKQREIVDLNRRLSVLNRIVRQDIRNDVSMVVGRGDELLGRVRPEDEPIVTSLLDAAQHAVELTETAGELMTVLSTDQTPEVEQVDLRALVEEQVQIFQEQHTVDITIDTRGPDATPVVRATPWLGTALTQLLANAVRHNDNDSPRITLTIEAHDETVTLAVADDGVGIPDAQKELLNDPDEWFDEQTGVGTGLYLVFTLVEQIDGEIEFVDNEPRGTVVRLTCDRVA